MMHADHRAKPPDPEPGGQLEVPTAGVNSHAQVMARASGLPLASEPIIGDTVRSAGDVMQKCDARNASTEGVGIEFYEPMNLTMAWKKVMPKICLATLVVRTMAWISDWRTLCPPIILLEQMTSRKKRDRNSSLTRMVFEM